MKNNSYTEKQIEAYNLLSQVKKGEVPEETVEEIINMLGESDNVSTPDDAGKEDTISNLKIKLLEEKDWRKKASLAAMIISKRLE